MQRRGIILYNISIYHVYKEEGHRPIVLNQCRNSATNTDPELKQHRSSVSLPSKHKTSAQHLYNVGPTSWTLVRPCTNAIQMPWAKDAQQASFKSWPNIHDIWLTQKRHPLNGSCSPERFDISALTQQTQGADPTLR